METTTTQSVQENILLAYNTARELDAAARKVGFRHEISCSIHPDEGQLFFYIRGLDDHSGMCFIGGINKYSAEEFAENVKEFKAYWLSQISGADAYKAAQIAELKKKLAELEG